MKKILKTQGQDTLTQYLTTNPQHGWTDFYNQSADYQQDKQLMLIDQGGLCAYCETKIDILCSSQQAVEHFHDKSDFPNINGHNWGLDWNNVFAVCLGGSNTNAHYPTPANLSCDKHKEHCKSIPTACEGYLLNPLDIIANPSLFEFNKANCHLIPNVNVCLSFQPRYNQYASVVELVQKTIDILNLNCNRLIDNRRQILNDYNREVKKIRESQNLNGFSQLAQRWFYGRWPSFFSTRRSLLGIHAETYLASIQYDG